ncbi:hypothetical protein Tco_0974799 [Tanacetum coccineum]|uniref:Phospholipase-like protein n=1 Tax=Tanacetum coccineum TaxID=301880 RepID=A0ABQ5EDP9_9ASTR
MLRRQHKVDDDHHDMPLIYYIEGHTLHFGHLEFSLITSFHFGTDEETFGKLSDEDTTPLCLLLALEVIFMGQLLTFKVDDTLFSLVENLKLRIHFHRVLAHERNNGQAKLQFNDEFSKEDRLRCEHEKLIVEEKMFRLEEAKRLRLEEEKMLQLAEEKNKKRKEFMNSTHGQVKCIFPWSDDYTVDRNFWRKLVCLDPARKDLWVDYIWHVRPENANWVMVSSYFFQLLLQNGMPLFYANEDMYATPWSEVDQVTFYDSKHTYDYEVRDWYKGLNQSKNSDFRMSFDNLISAQMVATDWYEVAEVAANDWYEVAGGSLAGQ